MHGPINIKSLYFLLCCLNNGAKVLFRVINMSAV